MSLARDHLQPSQKITLTRSRFAVNPGSMRHDGLLGRLDPLYGVKANVSLRGATTGRHFVFQKDRKDLDTLERAIGRIRQFQKKVSVGLNESKCKSLFFIAHRFLLLSVLRFGRPFFLLFASVSMSPG